MPPPCGPRLWPSGHWTPAQGGGTWRRLWGIGGRGDTGKSSEAGHPAPDSSSGPPFGAHGAEPRGADPALPPQHGGVPGDICGATSLWGQAWHVCVLPFLRPGRVVTERSRGFGPVGRCHQHGAVRGGTAGWAQWPLKRLKASLKEQRDPAGPQESSIGLGLPPREPRCTPAVLSFRAPSTPTAGPQGRGFCPFPRSAGMRRPHSAPPVPQPVWLWGDCASPGTARLPKTLALPDQP